MLDLDALAREATDLEPLPVSVTRLAALVCGDEPPDLDAVVEVVTYDQALTAALLRTANSSWSASRQPVATVRDAAVRLGTGPVLSLALGARVRSRMEQALPAYGLGESALWEHSVRALLAAELLGRAAPGAPPPETATAALLHDIGKLLLDRHLGPDAIARVQASVAAGATAAEAEAEVLGIDHAELGGLVAQAWGLPESLVVGIREHHAPRSSPVALAVHLADRAANEAGGAGPSASGTFARALEAFGLDPASFAAVGRETAVRADAVRARFG